MGRRCLTLPTLVVIAASERPWSGKTSTTQLLNGTMLEYLRATQEYAINPRDRAFSLLGSTHHAKLAQVEGNWISEQTQSGNGNPSGTPDPLEPDPEHSGSYILTDYKTFGSFRVAKMLGIVKGTSLHPTDVYVKSGKWGKAGTPKKVTTFTMDPTKVEMKEETLQLNHYRVLLQQHGYSISYMQIQVTVRDGSLQIARERGVTEPIYLVPIPKVADDIILDFFQKKHDALIFHIQHHIMPDPCNNEESWDHRRCKDYCDVAQFCPQGQRVQASNRV